MVSCVEDATEFAALRAEWDALQVNNDRTTVFMSWAWHYTWWGVFGGEDTQRLCVLCVRLRHELIAVLPMYSRIQAWPRPPLLMFLGTGEGEADEVATEYLDILASPDHVATATQAVLDFLATHSKKMRFEFQHLLENSIFAEAMRARSDRWRIQELDLGFRYRIDLHKQTDDLPMNPNRIKRVKRSLRAVERDGGFQQASIEDLEQLASVLEDVSTLSDQRQKHVGRAKSAFSSARFNRFHHRVLPLLYQSGSADIHHFYLDRELVATLYCYYDENTCHYYQSGFAQSLANRYMPLTVAHLMEIERNRVQGRRYYDFMRGDENSYKNEFNCELTPMITMVRFPSVVDQWLHETFTIVRQRIVRHLRSIGVSRRR